MHICDPSNKKIIALSFTKKSKVVIQVVIHFSLIENYICTSVPVYQHNGISTRSE